MAMVAEGNQVRSTLVLMEQVHDMKGSRPWPHKGHGLFYFGFCSVALKGLQRPFAAFYGW